MIPDDIQQKINQITTFTLRYKWSLLGAAGGILMLFILVRVISSFMIVNIEVSGAGNEQPQIYASTTTKLTNIGGPGLKIISSETKSLIATKGKYIKTQTRIDIPWYRYLDKKIVLQHDKNAEKIAYTNINTRACSSYSPRLESLLSYNCSEPITLSNAKGNSPSVVASFAFANRIATPYMGGVAGLVTATAAHANGALLVVKDTGEKYSYNLPSDIGKSDVGPARLYTNTLDTKENRVVIVDAKGTVFLGTPISPTKMNYVRYQAPADSQPDHQRTLCKIVADDVYCYSGLYAVGDAKHPEKPVRETVTKLSFTSQKAVVKEVDVAGAMIDTFNVTTSGELYGLYYKKLVRFTDNDGVYSPVEIAQNVDVAVASDKLYYIQEKGVFVVNESKDANQVFYSENIVAKGVSLVDGNVFVFGSAAGVGTTTYAYRLTDEANMNPGSRIIDIFPISFGRLPRVTQQDFIGNRLYLSLAVPVNRSAKNAVDAVDQGQFKQAQEEVLESLRRMGVDVNNLEITFKY